MALKRNNLIGVSAFAITLVILYGLLLIGQMKISASEQQPRFVLPPDSPEGIALGIVQAEVNPRPVTSFGINEKQMTATYTIKDSNYMGNISPLASEFELLRISCQLREAGYVTQAFQFLITMPTKDGEQTDGYAISLSNKTVQNLDCEHLQDVSVPAIADEYDYLYLKNPE